MMDGQSHQCRKPGMETYYCHLSHYTYIQNKDTVEITTNENKNDDMH